MTTTIVVANSNDGYITAGSPTNWDDAANGNAPTVSNGQVRNRYGAEFSIGIYWAYQTFLQFGYTRPTNEVEVGVTIGVLHAGHYGAVSRQLNMHMIGTGTGLPGWFGAGVDTGDWVNPLGVLLVTRGARVFDVQASGTSQYVWSGSDELTQRVRTFGTMAYQFVLATERQYQYGLFPTGPEFSDIWSGETSLAPVMVVTTVPQSTLFGTLGAQVQLSDGTWACIESDGAASPSLAVKHVNTAGTATTLYAISGFTKAGAGLTGGPGSQQVALCADSNDNLYLVGGWASVANSVAVQAFIKGTGSTWTVQGVVVGSLPYSEADVNNWSAAWHSVGGGTLVIMAARGSSDGWHVSSSEQCAVVASGPVALAGSGALVRGSAVSVGPFTPPVSAAVWTAPANDTGSNQDVTALSSTVGVMHTLSRYDRTGVRQPSCKTRYVLNDAGTAFAAWFYDLNVGQAGATWAVKTASGKVRVVPISTDTVAVLTADSVWGISVGILRNTGSGSTFTALGWVLLGNESIPSMPPAGTLAESQAWDVVYLSGPNKLWVYYLDTADSRRILRTSISLATNVATRDAVEVATGVGVAGSTNLALRVARGSATNRRVLLSVANRTSGGTLSTVYVVDTPNEAPLAPTLTTRSNFDATQAAVFSWVHNDPDGVGALADTQTRYQLDINTSGGVDAFDSGTVVSSTPSRTLAGGTLTNAGTWQWRVRTWDESGTAGAWSAYSTFSTGVGGTVTITSPAADNPVDVITSTWPVSWTLLGATQAAYRVVVKRVSNGAETYNSGWVASTVTTHTVTGLSTDVEYRIEVTTRTGGLVESNTATRLITPSYGTPDMPTITVFARPNEGHTLIVASNPLATGDRPDVVHNEIRRRVEATSTAAAGPWFTIGQTTPGGSWHDYSAASQVVYEYQAVAIAADNSYSLSTRVDGQLCLQGVWIHDPTNPGDVDLIQHYPYGWKGKADETSVEAQGTHYIGRELPVFDFGFSADETMTVPIQIPKGETWFAQFEALKALARLRRTLCVRDARGRRMFGVITNVPRVDESYGTSTELKVTAVDYFELYSALGDLVPVSGDGPDSDSDTDTDADWDGGDVVGGTDETIDGGDVCGGDPCEDDEIADGESV